MEDNKPAAQKIEALVPLAAKTPEPKSGSETGQSESSVELSDLKKRLDRSEREMKAMSEAMKTTLIDVRSMIQEMDNPFNLLKDMGVDKLVNKAVEEVESGVNKAKRDEAMKRMGNPTAIPEEPTRPQPLGYIDAAPLPKERGLSSRVDVMESVLKDLAETMDSTLDEIKARAEANAKRLEPPLPIPLDASHDDVFAFNDGNYTAYVQLVSEYLALRFGRRGAERLLLNEVTKNQSSPKVVRDILDSLSVRASKDKEETMEPRTLSISIPNADLDDKIMITMLLKSLDKPLAEWGSTAILYLLTVLVKRSTEAKLTRG